MNFFADLATNSVFAGLAGAAGFSALLFQARQAPKLLFEWLRKRLSVTLVIDSGEELFGRLSIYLSESPYVRKARWLRMVELYDYAEQKWVWRASFGLGWHLFRDQGCWFLLHRHIEDQGKSLLPQRRETVTLRTWGPSQCGIRGLMARAEEVYQSRDAVRVHVWHQGSYLLADQKPRRPLDTIFIPTEQKARLVADLERFLAARETYRARGTPYRRGYLLEGPPGTGKSTLAFVIACEAERPIYMINLNTAGGDTGLQAAFNLAEPGAVMVIEDIDTALIAHDRELAEERSAMELKPAEAVTLGGLLNAIDGLASRENRILVVTSNRAAKLDPALLRPGRIDHRETIGLIEGDQAWAMTMAFLGVSQAARDWFALAVWPRLPLSPAELQGMLLAEVDGHGGAVVPLRSVG
jgi:chaperone BCS1